MKELTTFGNKTFIIEDDEAENIKRFWREDISSPIELRSGAMINPKAIETISDIEVKPTYMGRDMDKNKHKVLTDSGWKQFVGRESDIKYIPVKGTNFKKIG